MKVFVMLRGLQGSEGTDSRFAYGWDFLGVFLSLAAACNCWWRDEPLPDGWEPEKLPDGEDGTDGDAAGRKGSKFVRAWWLCRGESDDRIRRDAERDKETRDLYLKEEQRDIGPGGAAYPDDVVVQELEIAEF